MPVPPSRGMNGRQLCDTYMSSCWKWIKECCFICFEFSCCVACFCTFFLSGISVFLEINCLCMLAWLPQVWLSLPVQLIAWRLVSENIFLCRVGQKPPLIVKIIFQVSALQFLIAEFVVMTSTVKLNLVKFHSGTSMQTLHSAPTYSAIQHVQ